MEFSFLNQAEENVKYNLTFPYHIKFEKLLGNHFYNKDVDTVFHTHDFESVLKRAYEEPLAFYLTEEDKEFYSKQELIFIEKVIEDESNKINNGYKYITLNIDEKTMEYLQEYKTQRNMTFEEAIIDIFKQIVAHPETLT